MRAKQVRIVYGDQEGFCLESSVAVWERHGWTRADDGSSTESPVPEAPAAEPVPEDEEPNTREAQ